VVAKRANPRDAQLRERDTFTIRYGRQALHELEVMSDILEARWLCQQRSKRGTGRDVKQDSYVILETAESTSEIAFFEVLPALDLASE